MKKAPKSKDIIGAMAALERAAPRAREVAIQTNTALIFATDDGRWQRVVPSKK